MKIVGRLVEGGLQVVRTLSHKSGVYDLFSLLIYISQKRGEKGKGKHSNYFTKPAISAHTGSCWTNQKGHSRMPNIMLF